MASASKIQAIIKKRGGKYHLVSHKGKTLGVHSTREEALKQEQAIEIAKHARQLADGIGQMLAATEHDERGRFTGPGGGGGSYGKEDKPTSSTLHESNSNPARRHWNDALEHSRSAESAASKAYNHEYEAHKSGVVIDKAHLADMHEEAAGHFRKEAESWRQASRSSHPDSRIAPGAAKSKGSFTRHRKETESRAAWHEDRAANLRKEAASEPQKKLPGF